MLLLHTFQPFAQRVGHVIIDGVVDPKSWVSYQVTTPIVHLSILFSSISDLEYFAPRRREDVLCFCRWLCDIGHDGL